MEAEATLWWILNVGLFMEVVLWFNRCAWMMMDRTDVRQSFLGTLTFVVLGFNDILIRKDAIEPSIAWLTDVNPLYYLDRTLNHGAPESTLALLAALATAMVATAASTWRYTLSPPL